MSLTQILDKMGVLQRSHCSYQVSDAESSFFVITNNANHACKPLTKAISLTFYKYYKIVTIRLFNIFFNPNPDKA